MSRRTQNEDLYFTCRLGIIFVFLFLILNFLGQIARTEPREIISPVPIVKAKETSGEVLPTPIPSQKQVIPKTIPEMIIEYSEKYQVDPLLVSCILENESHFRPEAIGDNGLAVGIAQFHLNTFKTFRRLMGETGKDLRTNPEESIKILCWALSTGRGYHWTAYRRCK